MIVTMNGNPLDLPAPSTVDDLVATVRPDRRGVAVAVNGEVAPRATWSGHLLAHGDVIEVITAVQGG